MKLAFTNILPIFSLFILFSLFSPILAQWPKHIIDDYNINNSLSVDAADMNGDTKLDLLVTNPGRQQIILYLNDFPQWNKSIIDNVMATFAYTGDIDGDDTLDIVASLFLERNMVWYENNHPIWTKHIIDDNTDVADFFVVVDLDNDDTLDVVTTTTSSYYNKVGAIVWYENNHPTWTKHIIESDIHGSPEINVTDIDGDGILDIVATFDGAHKVILYKTEDNGLSWTKYPIDDNLIYAFGIDIGDIDGDDTMDVVITTGGPYFDGSEVIWYENNHPIWTKHVIDTDLDGALSPIIMDVNGNGKMDVIANGFGDGIVVWYENHHPTWPKHIIDANLNGPKLFAVSDVDGDDIKDVIVTATSSVVWYKNPYTAVAYGDSLEVIPKYVTPESDTLIVNAKLVNPENHTVIVYAMISGDEYSYQDSIELFDDGLHDNGVASDNIYGGSKPLTALEEDYYTIKLRTTDSDESLATYCGIVGYFTTIGPIEATAIYYDWSAERQYIKLVLHNDGSITSASNLKITIGTTDPRVKEKLFFAKSLPDLAAGITDTSSFSYNFYYSDGYAPDSTIGNPILFDYSISSDKIPYWEGSFAFTVTPVGVEEEQLVTIPNEFVLNQNYPNPFNPSTTIKYSIPSRSVMLNSFQHLNNNEIPNQVQDDNMYVKLKVYDILGREVATLVNQKQKPGNYEVAWSVVNQPSGVYFYQLTAGTFTETKKLIVLK